MQIYRHSKMLLLKNIKKFETAHKDYHTVG